MTPLRPAGGDWGLGTEKYTHIIRGDVWDDLERGIQVTPLRWDFACLFFMVIYGLIDQDVRGIMARPRRPTRFGISEGFLAWSYMPCRDLLLLIPP